MSPAITRIDAAATVRWGVDETGAPPASPSLAPYMLLAAAFGIAAVAAIKLAHLWLAQTPILDFSL